MQFEFSKVEDGECILIPGNIVVMERMKETGSLPKYMNDHLKWIGSTYAGDKGFVRRICTLFSSLPTIPQLWILSKGSYTCPPHREDRSLGYRRQHFVRSCPKIVVQHHLGCWCHCMGTVVHKLRHLTPRTSPRQVFSPTRKYVFDTYSLFIAYQILLVHCPQWASRARIKPFLCAASPYVRRSASSASRHLCLPESLLPFSGFVQPLLRADFAYRHEQLFPICYSL
jgi:hypothetical protein